jgi:hypothetical protein
LEHSVPGLVARAYHRVKCVRDRNMTRSIAPFFFASRHSQSGQNLHQSLAATKPCRSSEQVVTLFIADRSFRIHLAERWLMAT